MGTVLATLKDLFHVSFKCNFAGSDYIKWMGRPFIAFIHALLGVRNKDRYLEDYGQTLETEHILSRVEEIVTASTNRIRDDVQELAKELKEYSHLVTKVHQLVSISVNDFT